MCLIVFIPIRVFYYYYSIIFENTVIVKTNIILYYGYPNVCIAFVFEFVLKLYCIIQLYSTYIFFLSTLSIPCTFVSTLSVRPSVD